MFFGAVESAMDAARVIVKLVGDAVAGYVVAGHG
jgi:hypothetical protein